MVRSRAMENMIRTGIYQCVAFKCFCCRNVVKRWRSRPVT